MQQALGGGIETYHAAARKVGPPQSLQSVVFRVDRFVGDTAYLTGQVRSAYAGDAGVRGRPARLRRLTRLAEGWVLAAEMLAGAAGAAASTPAAAPSCSRWSTQVFDLTRSLSLRGRGWVRPSAAGCRARRST